jgi:hypothetical protein
MRVQPKSVSPARYVHLAEERRRGEVEERGRQAFADLHDEPPPDFGLRITNARPDRSGQ